MGTGAAPLPAAQGEGLCAPLRHVCAAQMPGQAKAGGGVPQALCSMLRVRTADCMLPCVLLGANPADQRAAAPHDPDALRHSLWAVTACNMQG